MQNQSNLFILKMRKGFLNNRLLAAVTLTNVETALALSEAFLEGGLDVMEITFRTPATASAIRAIAKEFPSMKVGAGTILSADQIAIAKDAGAQFGLSPGFHGPVAQKAQESNFPFIPGVCTPSEIEKALAHNFELVKVFPVANMGGPSYIKSLQAPYGNSGIHFLPMGGVDNSNLKEYLKFSKVVAVGGSWLAPRELIENREFKKITSIVRQSLDRVHRLG